MTDYWSWCPIHKADCLKRSECTSLEKCVDRLETIGAAACAAYDYCPKREDCLAAARCLDTRAGPPRRVGAGLAHIPLAEVPEDRESLAPATRVIVQDDNAKIRVSFHEIELDPYRAIRLGIDLIQAGLRHLERAKRPD